MNYLPWLTQKRVIVFSIAYVALVATIASLSFTTEVNRWGIGGLKIFGSYWVSGRAALEGQNPYESYSLTWNALFDIAEINLNPPTVLPLFEFIANFDPVAAARTWTIVAALLFATINIALIRGQEESIQRQQIIWMFLAPSFANTLHIGQLYIFLFALAAGAWTCLRQEKNFIAGVLIGVLCVVKPNFLVWPLFLLLTRQWRPTLSAALTSITFVGLSIILYGYDIYLQWLTAFLIDRHAERFLIETSIYGYVSRLGFPALGTVTSVIFFLGSALFVWHYRIEKSDASRLALVVAILASPLAWVDYTLCLIPAMISRPWEWKLTVAAALLMTPHAVPISMMGGSMWMTIVGGSIYFGAIVLIFIAFLIEAKKSATAHERDISSIERRPL